jgi:4-amino-4-deoxy-L-arabinose transferase-like glycosyltransferase
LRDAVGRRHARLAGWLWVVYPFAINYSASEVWDYALTSMLFAWCFYLSQRLHLRRPLAWLGFGLVYGITALSNPSILSALPFLFLIALWRAHRAGTPWLLRASLSVLGVLLMIAPWTLRNYRVLHAPVPIRDGFWLEFWAGNHGDTSTSNPPDAHPATNPVEMDKFSAMGESAYLAGTHDLAMRYVHQHPLAFASISMRRALRFWTGFWSFSPAYIRSQPLDVPNVFFCTCVTLFMLQGIRRWWREDAGRVLPYLAVIAVFPFPYYLTHSSMDYRQPIEPQVIMLVAIGILGFRQATSSRRQS